MEDADSREAYTIEFWDRLEEENPEVMQYVIGHTEVLPDDDSRSHFLDGVFTIYEFIRRQIEAENMEYDS